MPAVVDELFSAAHEQYRKKNFDAALKILDELKNLAPDRKEAYALESEVWRALENPVKEFRALEKILPLLKFSTPDEKIFAFTALNNIGNDCYALARTAEGLEFQRLAAALTQEKKELLAMTDTRIFNANCLENFSADEFRALYDEYKKFLADVKPFPRKFFSHEKIRVGFISADFHNHPVINQAWALLTRLDKNIFDVCLYSSDEKSDAVTEHLRATAGTWRDVKNFSDEQLAELIRADETDILFDLSGHTHGNRLRAAAYRPASVQVSGIGYVNSTGLDCFDYFLSDVYCAGDENFFTEKLIKLEHSHFCHEPSTKFSSAAPPPCVKNNFVTFGSFNQFQKMTDSILRAWKKILDAVPDSRLIIKGKLFNTDDGKIFAGKRLKNFGFDLGRVEMRPFAVNWLAEYADVDIALDTFPYTGGVTTCEALYMGVPVVSLFGQRHGSRFGLSILKNVGLEELAVGSYDEYIARAVMLAGDWELLSLLRKNLRPMMKKSPLMNSELYLREIQAAFKKILEESKRNDRSRTL